MKILFLFVTVFAFDIFRLFMWVEECVWMDWVFEFSLYFPFTIHCIAMCWMQCKLMVACKTHFVASFSVVNSYHFSFFPPHFQFDCFCFESTVYFYYSIHVSPLDEKTESFVELSFNRNNVQYNKQETKSNDGKQMKRNAFTYCNIALHQIFFKALIFFSLKSNEYKKIAFILF